MKMVLYYSLKKASPNAKNLVEVDKMREYVDIYFEEETVDWYKPAG